MAPTNVKEKKMEAKNPVVKTTPLRAYPGWVVRQYANGMYDGAQANGIGLTGGCGTFNKAVAAVRAAATCTCPQDARGPWDCLDCPAHGKDAAAACAAEQAAEIAAENAWATYAEQGTADDYAFEQYEARMGLV